METWKDILALADQYRLHRRLTTPHLPPGHPAPGFLNQDQRQRSVNATFHSLHKKARENSPLGKETAGEP